MHNLYDYEVEYENLDKARDELNEISKELSMLSPDKAVWNMDRPDKEPDSRYQTKDAASLADYFITPDGANLIKQLNGAISRAKGLETNLYIWADNMWTVKIDGTGGKYRKK